MLQLTGKCKKKQDKKILKDIWTHIRVNHDSWSIIDDDAKEREREWNEDEVQENAQVQKNFFFHPRRVCKMSIKQGWIESEDPRS